MKNQIPDLYSDVLASITTTPDALPERLHSVRETPSLRYDRMIGNIDYKRERVKDLVDQKAREEEQKENNINLSAK